MKYFDLHCDTLTEILPTKGSLFHNHRMVDLSLQNFEQYTQVMAIFCHPARTADDAWALFESCLAHLTSMQVTLPSSFCPLLSVENASLIGNRIERIDRMAEAGVRLMNPVWAGDNLLGGAWDTHNGLTDFGRAAILRAYANKIIPDLSHASDETAKEILKMAAKRNYPVIASHSCARTIHPHRRNLPDDFAKEIMASGGVIGLSFYPRHLTEGDCDRDTIRRHLEHYLSLGGEDHLAIGADWDGIEITPDGVTNIGDIPALANELAQQGWSEKLLRKVFYQNAANFMNRAYILL